VKFSKEALQEIYIDKNKEIIQNTKLPCGSPLPPPKQIGIGDKIKEQLKIL
jgi:hypothetical protein